jgi:RNA polymerase sigma-70 factor (ECF subfamily)
VLTFLNQVWTMHSRDILKRCVAWSGGREEDGREAFSRAWNRAAVTLISERPQLINARAWLLKLAYHACMDLHRERSRRGEQEFDITGPAVHDAALHYSTAPEDPERLALNKELSAFLLAEVERLPLRLRDAMLVYMGSGEYGEVVARFGITDVNARKRIQQARAILRERLADYLCERTPGRRR